MIVVIDKESKEELMKYMKSCNEFRKITDICLRNFMHAKNYEYHNDAFT